MDGYNPHRDPHSPFRIHVRFDAATGEAGIALAIRLPGQQPMSYALTEEELEMLSLEALTVLGVLASHHDQTIGFFERLVAQTNASEIGAKTDE